MKIKIINPNTTQAMTDGYESWWNVGIATTSSKESVRKACVGVLEGRREARDY